MKRLYARLFLWFFVANVATLLLTAFIGQRIAHSIFERNQPNWQALANEAAERYRTGGPAALEPWLHRLRRRHIDAVLLDDSRDVLGRPPPAPLVRHLPALTAAPEVLLTPRPELTLAGIAVGDGAHPLRFVAIRRLEPPHHHFFWLPLMIELIVSLLVIAVIGWFSARGIARPVATVQMAARRVAGGDLSARIGAPLAGSESELGQLARDFDRMAERIQALVERTRGLLQDISHELRSPLARLQLALELIRRGHQAERGAHLAQAETEIARIDRLLGEVLALTRMEAGLPERLDQPVELSELLRERTTAAAEDAARRDIRLRLSTTPVTVLGQRELLARAIDNLLSNAVKFSPVGGEVALCLEREAGAAVLSVTDHGPGVAADEFDRLFMPFFRGRNAELVEGQGLGLAIVARIARAHGGAVEAVPGPGGGLQIRLRLPTTAVGLQSPA
ncbi:MAG: HAMP domain-containing histidine kinase [Gammaproteobacteria bacterium]|nr:HAMP domain-containing histidine kinase [Gammaproteobacteria bacterium]